MFGYRGFGRGRFALGAGYTGISLSPGAAQITFSGYAPTLSYTFPANRISWMGVEVLHVGVSLARVSWMGVEVLHIGDSSARVSWMGVEVLRSIEVAIEQSGGVFILW
jgi:hypothetical protein